MLVTSVLLEMHYDDFFFCMTQVNGLPVIKWGSSLHKASQILAFAEKAIYFGTPGVIPSLNIAAQLQIYAYFPNIFSLSF